MGLQGMETVAGTLLVDKEVWNMPACTVGTIPHPLHKDGEKVFMIPLCA
jgi:hypothetical protein